ncbi:MAG: Uma2 family endonuclease [Planctomycetaceae bacterium]
MTTLALPPPLLNFPRSVPRERPTTSYSPEDSLIIPDGERYELVNGQLQEKSMSGHLRVVPDLAVEVTSANDSLLNMDQKVEEYLAAGVRSVWWINPNVRVVQVFRSDGTSQRLRDLDELSGPDILPGFVCQVRDLLPALSTETPEPSATAKQ